VGVSIFARVEPSIGGLHEERACREEPGGETRSDPIEERPPRGHRRDDGHITNGGEPHVPDPGSWEGGGPRSFKEAPRREEERRDATQRVYPGRPSAQQRPTLQKKLEGGERGANREAKGRVHNDDDDGQAQAGGAQGRELDRGQEERRCHGGDHGIAQSEAEMVHGELGVAGGIDSARPLPFPRPRPPSASSAVLL
jgi:hypothetical protein